jgi:hypothetical protein
MTTVLMTTAQYAPIIRWNVVLSIVITASVFVFLTVFWWALQRRRERESYYRYELARQMLERSDTPHPAIIEWVREVDAIEQRRRREGVLMTACIAVLTGIGALIPVGTVFDDESSPGMIAAGLGLALFIYLAITRRTSRQ